MLMLKAGMLTVRLLNLEQLLMHMPQPVEAGVCKTVLQVVWVWGNAHHVQLILPQQQGPY